MYGQAINDEIAGRIVEHANSPSIDSNRRILAGIECDARIASKWIGEKWTRPQIISVSHLNLYGVRTQGQY